eukprot:jgi/Bigna1/81131/fgenesh1_pg.77_\
MCYEDVSEADLNRGERHRRVRRAHKQRLREMAERNPYGWGLGGAAPRPPRHLRGEGGQRVDEEGKMGDHIVLPDSDTNEYNELDARELEDKVVAMGALTQEQERFVPEIPSVQDDDVDRLKRERQLLEEGWKFRNPGDPLDADSDADRERGEEFLQEMLRYSPQYERPDVANCNSPCVLSPSSSVMTRRRRPLCLIPRQRTDTHELAAWFWEDGVRTGISSFQVAVVLAMCLTQLKHLGKSRNGPTKSPGYGSRKILEFNRELTIYIGGYFLTIIAYITNMATPGNECGFVFYLAVPAYNINKYLLFRLQVYKAAIFDVMSQVATLLRGMMWMVRILAVLLLIWVGIMIIDMVSNITVLVRLTSLLAYHPIAFTRFSICKGLLLYPVCSLQARHYATIANRAMQESFRQQLSGTRFPVVTQFTIKKDGRY